MNKFIALISFIFVVSFASYANAQVASGNPGYQQFSIGGTAVQVLIFDGTRIDWTIHPNSGAIRCKAGLTNGSDPNPMPTASVGFEMSSGSYINNLPNTNPTTTIWCIAETGTVVTDVWWDSRY